MYKLKLRRKFIWKLNQIKEFIALDNIEKSIEIENFILDYMKILKYYPLMGRRIDNTFRQIVLPKYKYKIVYEIDKKNKTILLYSIWRGQKKF